MDTVLPTFPTHPLAVSSQIVIFFRFNNPLLYSTYSVYTAPVSFAWMVIAERFFHYFLLFVLFYYRFSVHNYIYLYIHINMYVYVAHGAHEASGESG